MRLIYFALFLFMRINLFASDSLNVKTIPNPEIPSFGEMIFKLIFFFIILVGIIYSIAYVLKKMRARSHSSLFGKNYSILETIPLTSNKFLQLIEVIDRVYLISVANDNIEVLDKIIEKEKIDEIKLKYSNKGSENKFDNIFSKIMKR